MHQLVTSRCQLVIATHSPILLAYPDARIYLLDAEGIHATAYDETEHYCVTKAFLDNPTRMLERLLGEVERDGAGPRGRRKGRGEGAD